ncbi:hypothetical protein ABZ897_12280 [Nonomuraea sp. NPDC046802]|uniref:hypothetical protein n=1 Tax=Nonomuraea sp. NPDC046802 TaxID=3154919 RepID=UPI0033FCCD1E
MSGTQRSSPRPDQDERRRRVVMAAGVVLGTVMLAGAAGLAGGAFTGRTLDALHWPGGQVPSPLHTAPASGFTSAAVGTLSTSPAPLTKPSPTTFAPSAPTTSAPPPTAPATKSALSGPGHSFVVSPKAARPGRESRTPAPVRTGGVAPQPARSPAPAVTRTLPPATTSPAEIAPSPDARRTRHPRRIPSSNPTQ